MLKNNFENLHFEIFAKVVHNFGKSDDYLHYLVKKCLFPILDRYVVSCPTCTKDLRRSLVYLSLNTLENQIVLSGQKESVTHCNKISGKVRRR